MNDKSTHEGAEAYDPDKEKQELERIVEEQAADETKENERLYGTDEDLKLFEKADRLGDADLARPDDSKLDKEGEGIDEQFIDKN